MILAKPGQETHPQNVPVRDKTPIHHRIGVADGGIPVAPDLQSATATGLGHRRKSLSSGCRKRC